MTSPMGSRYSTFDPAVYSAASSKLHPPRVSSNNAWRLHKCNTLLVMSWSSMGSRGKSHDISQGTPRGISREVWWDLSFAGIPQYPTESRGFLHGFHRIMYGNFIDTKLVFQAVESRGFPWEIPWEFSGGTEGYLMGSQVGSLIFRWDPPVSRGNQWIHTGNQQGLYGILWELGRPMHSLRYITVYHGIPWGPVGTRRVSRFP